MHADRPSTELDNADGRVDVTIDVHMRLLCLSEGPSRRTMHPYSKQLHRYNDGDTQTWSTWDKDKDEDKDKERQRSATQDPANKKGRESVEDVAAYRAASPSSWQ